MSVVKEKEWVTTKEWEKSADEEEWGVSKD